MNKDRLGLGRGFYPVDSEQYVVDSSCLMLDVCCDCMNAMTITLTTPAILFPAISLLLLAYTNRFMALASVVRTLVNSGRGELDENRRLQIGNLNIRIQLVRWMQAAGVGSLFSCVVSIIMLYVELLQIGGGLFVLSLVLMMGSLALSFWEIMLSGRALQLELKRCESGSQPKAM